MAPDHLTPLLAPVLGISATAGYTPVTAEGSALYKMIAEAVEAYLLACFGAEPGMVIVEDVHWFDSSTLETLGSLLNAGHGGMLMVLTTRDRALPGDWPVDEIQLNPLTGKGTDALIAALAPGLSVEQRREVADRCDGVPFYVEQIVNAVDEDGVPEALYEPLLARLRARANAVPVLEAAAVIGRHIDRGLLCSVVGLHSEELDSVLDELERALVLEPSGSNGWRFRHELLREVADELAPPTVRRGLHAGVADALAAKSDPDYLVVARHYEHAERFEAAAGAYRRAAAEARHRGALLEACNYLSRALTQLEQCGPGRHRDRLELTVRLERSFLMSAAQTTVSTSVAADLERCLKLGGTDLRDDELFGTLTALGGYYSARADVNRLASTIELLRTRLREGRQWMLPIIDGASGVLEVYRGDFDAARAYLERAVAEWEADPRELDAVWFVTSDPIASSYQRLAFVHAMQGDLEGAEADLDRAFRRTNGLGFPQSQFSRAFTLFAEVMILTEGGHLVRAVPLAKELTRYAKHHGMQLFELVGTGSEAIVDGLNAVRTRVGDTPQLTELIATLGSAVDTLRGIDLNTYIAFFYAALARLLLAAGDIAGARSRLDAALKLGEDVGAHFYDAELLRLRAHTQASAEHRRADLLTAIGVARDQGAVLFELRAALDYYDRFGQPALDALRDASQRVPADSTVTERGLADAILALRR